MSADDSILIFGLSGLAGTVLRGLVLTAGAVLWTLLLVRLVGLRALSKANAFDFIATVATASLIAQASAVTQWGDYVQVLTAITAVFALQWLLARANIASRAVDQMVNNQPRLLLQDGQMLQEAMKDARISRDTLLEKLRSANVKSIGDVRAVILETTGEFSIIQGDVEDEMMEGVRGYREGGRP